MFEKSVRRGVKYFLVLAFILVIPIFILVPIKAWGQVAIAPDTDNLQDQIYSYWDLRARESFFQVTNTSGGTINIHIQVFNSATGCEEFDFIDTLTANDTALYNVRNLTRHRGTALAAPDLTDGFGFIVVSDITNGVTGSVDALIGNFRIIDDSGYEYRTNSPGIVDNALPGLEFTFNFDALTTGENFADVIGIPILASEAGNNPANLRGDPAGFTSFDVTLFDEFEGSLSCSEVTFSCFSTIGPLDTGINQAIFGSKGGRLCGGTDKRGFVHLDLVNTDGANVFVGLIGVNNGDGTGSMDSWWLNFPPQITLVGATTTTAPIK